MTAFQKWIIALIILILASFLFLFQRNTNEKNTFPVTQTITTISPSIKINWEIYTNPRFGFSIEYPRHWPTGKEYDNGDGVALYKDKSNNEILAYGTNMPSTFSTQNDPVEREDIVLDDGRKATTLKLKDEAGKIRYIMFFNQNAKQYVFYARTDEQFFNENEQVLRTVAKSFTLVN